MYQIKYENKELINKKIIHNMILIHEHFRGPNPKLGYKSKVYENIITKTTQYKKNLNNEFTLFVDLIKRFIN